MTEGDSFKLIFRSKTYSIPQNFPFLSDVNGQIYKTLLTTKRYNVKSNVREDVFLSFINNWTSQEIPIFSIDNINDFEILSQEFDRMKNLIQVFKKHTPAFEFSYIMNNNLNLQKKIKSDTAKLQKKTQLFMNIYAKFRKIEESFPDKKEKEKFINTLKDSEPKLMELCTKISSKSVEDYILSFLSEFNETENKRVEIDQIVYEIIEHEKTAILFKCQSNEKEIMIPKTVTYKDQQYVVKKISARSFYSNKTIKTISFPADSAVQIIGKESFSYSSIEMISISSKVTTIEEEAFYYCDSLKKVTFQPDSEICLIGKRAFSHTNLEEISIASDSLQIGEEVFADCKSLKVASFEKIHSIGAFAFKKSEIEKIFISSSVVELKNGWLKEANFIQDIKIIQAEIENIKQYQNDDFIIGKSDTFCENYDILLFASKSIKTVTIPSFIKRICECAFAFCENLEEVIFHEDSELILIDEKAFYDSSIKSISIPPHVTEICDRAFACEDLQTVNFAPDSELQVIGFAAFSSSGIKSISIPATVTNISFLSFDCRQLENVTFCDDSKLRVIEQGAFSFSGIHRISIPPTAVDVGRSMSACTWEMEEVTIKGKNPFYYAIENGQILIGKSNLLSDDFDFLYFVNKKKKSVTIPSYVKVIGPYAMEHCKSLKKVEFQKDSKLVSIQASAFEFSSIVKITLPQSLVKIGYHAFIGCRNLQIVNFSDVLNSNLKIIGEAAFCNCDKLMHFTFPSSLEVIKKAAFQNCECLQKVVFPVDSRLRIIEKNAFSGSSIKSIKIPLSVQRIGKDAFFPCSSLLIIEIDEKSKLSLDPLEVFSKKSILMKPVNK